MPHAHARGFPSPSLVQSNARGGQAPALRENQDPEGAPTGKMSRPGGLSYVEDVETGKEHQRIYETPSDNYRNGFMKHPQLSCCCVAGTNRRSPGILNAPRLIGANTRRDTDE